MHIRKQFALKTLNPMTMTELTAMRLQKEAQAAGRLDHPNVVRAFDFGLIDGVQPFLVMEFVEGPTLHQYLRDNGKMSVEMALEVFIPLAQALGFAHNLGVVHRDLKPSNVILAPGEHGINSFTPKIVDFGIAKLQFSDEHNMTLTGTGDVFGTPLYMSPEKCAGTGIDERTDIYSLGCMLFEVLTGAPPFNGRNPLEIMMQHGSAPLPTLKEASLGGRFPAALERVVQKMLAKERDYRYSSCHAVAEDLAKIQSGEGDGVARTTMTTLVAPAQSKRGAAVQVIGAGLIGLLIGATLGFGAGLMKSSVPAAKEARVTIPGAADNMWGLGVDYSSSYFSKKGSNSEERVFSFSKSKYGVLGTLAWWQNGQLHEAAADGRVAVPDQAKLVFCADSAMLLSPQLWASFHPDELSGIVLKSHTCWTNDEPLNQSISLMTQQNNLGLLILGEKNLSSKTLHRIGQIENLGWLELSQIGVDDKPLTGGAVAALPNLKNLRVLKVFGVVSTSRLIEELAAARALKRLGLRDANLVRGDSRLLGKLKSLEVLNITGSQDLVGDEFVQAISQLPNLKYLAVDKALLVNCKPESLRRLKGLTILSNARDNDRQWQDVVSNMPSCHFLFDNKPEKIAARWFDPLREDPAQMGIWQRHL
jgi:serine/threonine protein kinase